MPESDQGSGEGKEGAVHVAMALVADAQTAELVEPVEPAFHDPAFAAFGEQAILRRARQDR